MNYKQRYETEVKKLQKAKELIEHLEKLLRSVNYEIIDGNSKFLRMKSELSSLESESGEEEEMSGKLKYFELKLKEICRDNDVTFEECLNYLQCRWIKKGEQQL